MEKKRVTSLKIGNRNIVFAAHLQFFLIGNAFGAIVKKTGHLCIFDIISMDHSQTCAGVHNAHGMLETILIQVFGKFFFNFCKIVICHGQTSFFL